ncbi:MAG: aldo/keto reductase [Oscillospiraceae bacterium]|nr:aldo/keto reductase [Oscillospiraceae bacterium]
MNKLGFGFLRLPQTEGGCIDWTLLEAMADIFLASGGDYFDTAYTYLDGISETALKRTVVECHLRDCFRIADKLPSWKVHSRDECDRYFQEQLMRCGVDYFDVYLLHWLNQANYAIAEQYDEFHFLNRLKADGQIRKTGFSYHGDAATLEKITRIWTWYNCKSTIWIGTTRQWRLTSAMILRPAMARRSWLWSRSKVGHLPICRRKLPGFSGRPHPMRAQRPGQSASRSHWSRYRIICGI